MLSVVEILLGNGDGSFTPSASPPATDSEPEVLVVGDFNGDGRLDLVDETHFGAVSIFLQIGEVTLFPSTLTFGDRLVGTTSAAQTVTLTNGSSTTLSIANIAASGDYTQTNNCGASLAADMGCAIHVSFTPTTTGSRTGTLTVTDNANGVNGSQQTTSLTGTGISPGGSLSPTSLLFGHHAIGTASAVKNVTLTSTGTTSLSFFGITFTGANAGDFAQTNNCPPSAAPGVSCTISVTFTPSIHGTETATLNVNDNAANSPQTVALSGTGVLQAGLSPTSLTFAARTVGSTSAAKIVTLTNNLTTTVTISSFTFTGANAGDFAQTNTCGTSLGAKKQCTISVTFTPTAIGTRTATLNANDSANNSPQTAALTGTGK